MLQLQQIWICGTEDWLAVRLLPVYG